MAKAGPSRTLKEEALVLKTIWKLWHVESIDFLYSIVPLIICSHPQMTRTIHITCKRFVMICKHSLVTPTNLEVLELPLVSDVPDLHMLVGVTDSGIPRNFVRGG